MSKRLAIIQAVFNLADPYQRRLYEHVIPPGTTNKSDAAKRIFIRDMEGRVVRRERPAQVHNPELMRGLI